MQSMASVRLPSMTGNIGFLSSFRHSGDGVQRMIIPVLSRPVSLSHKIITVAVVSTAQKNQRQLQPSSSYKKTQNADKSTLPNLHSLSISSRGQHMVREKNTAGATIPKFSKASRRFYNQAFREPQRLSKVLAAAGVASRRACEEIIFEARVTVNGEVCKIPQTMVDPLKDIIYVDGKSLPKKLAPKLYFVLNKPKGYICSSSDEDNKSVLRLFDEYMRIWEERNPGLPKPRLFTVGRLDVATTGLLFVTNDGNFAHHLSHPSSGITKEYIATIGDKITKRQLQTIMNGTEVQGVMCIPQSVEVIDGEKGQSRVKLRIEVSEGRNHEVRELVANAGLEVHALKRVRIGGYRLPRTLGLGKHLVITEANLRNSQLMPPK